MTGAGGAKRERDAENRNRRIDEGSKRRFVRGLRGAGPGQLPGGRAGKARKLSRDIRCGLREQLVVQRQEKEEKRGKTSGVQRLDWFWRVEVQARCAKDFPR